MRFRVGAAAAAGVAVLALAALAPACGSTDEIVARVRCTSNEQCATDSFCSRPTCDAPTGTCELRQQGCDARDWAPVCGCPSTTEGGAPRPGPLYWNDCIRKIHGETSSAAFGGDGGACSFTSTSLASCSSTTSDECPGSFCALLRLGGCRAPVNPNAKSGLCIVPPEQCPPTFDLAGMIRHSFPVVTCDTALTCTDLCTAVRSGSSFAFADSMRICQ